MMIVTEKTIGVVENIVDQTNHLPHPRKLIKLNVGFEQYKIITVTRKALDLLKSIEVKDEIEVEYWPIGKFTPSGHFHNNMICKNVTKL